MHPAKVDPSFIVTRDDNYEQRTRSYRALHCSYLDHSVFTQRVDIATNLSLRLFGTRVWPRVAHVYFGASGVAGHGRSDRSASLIAARIRELGVGRILYHCGGGRPRRDASHLNFAFAFFLFLAESCAQRLYCALASLRLFGRPRNGLNATVLPFFPCRKNLLIC